MGSSADPWPGVCYCPIISLTTNREKVKSLHLESVAVTYDAQRAVTASEASHHYAKKKKETKKTNSICIQYRTVREVAKAFAVAKPCIWYVL